MSSADRQIAVDVLNNLKTLTMKVDILNTEGQSTGRTIELSDEVFGIEPNEHVVYLAVKQYLANQRQGTHKAKERGEVKGSRRKLKRQKGTGTARAGDIKNPIYRGGGRVFGPRPRKYTLKLNKKVKRLAKKSVLSDKAQNDQIVVIEDFTFEAPKTKAYVSILEKLGLKDQKSLLVLPEMDKNIYRSGRNIPKVFIRRASDLNPYDMLNGGKMILSEGAVEQLNALV